MRQLMITGARCAEWLDAPDPELGGELAALVRPVATATCDFDHLIAGGHGPVGPPCAIGHESVAEVIEVGAAVHDLRVGDRVIVPYQVSCGVCGRCRRGNTGSCEAVPWLSCYGLGPLAGDFGGAMDDIVRVPYADAMLVPLPAALAPAMAAAVSCNLPDAYRCVDALVDEPGQDVLIAGGAFDSIAMYTIQIARALGAGRVDYLDDDPNRRARADALGATVVSPSEARQRGYPVTVDCSMNTERLSDVVAATAPDGVCTVSTMYADDPTPIPLFRMFMHCVTLRTGQPHIRAVIPDVLQLVVDGKVDPAAVTTSVVDWSDAPAAFTSGAGKTVCVRS